MPPIWSRHVKPWLRKSRWLRRLHRYYWTARFRLLYRSSRGREHAAAELPVPPPELQRLVGGDRDFLEMGRLCASRLEEALARSGVDVHALGTVLDFGCGCGRTLRHFKHLERTRLHGTDYNPVLVEWCLRNLHFAEFSLNGLEPPLAHAEAAFDLVYALSVFTHLPEPLQHSWMRELARVVKPGGYLALSTMPEETLPTPDARQRFLAGDLVVLNAGEAGTNGCTAYHPRAYMTDRLATAFDVVEYVPNGVGQHLWLLRKKPAGGGPAG